MLIRSNIVLYVTSNKDAVANNNKTNKVANINEPEISFKLPRQLNDLCSNMTNKTASNKLYSKICEFAKKSKHKGLYVTKISYCIHNECPCIVLTSLHGKESFEANVEFLLATNKKLSFELYVIELNNKFTQHEHMFLEKYNDYCQKKISRDEAKSLVKERYKIGDVLMLKSKIRDGSKKNYKKYIIKKIIWSINSNPVNIIVVKQISGPVTNMSLSKTDCKRYHIKYEENLQVYSMIMNFIKISK